jgi:MFS superfamily sulfate permease-like transporter
MVIALELLGIVLFVVSVTVAGCFIRKKNLLTNKLLDSIFPVAELFIKAVIANVTDPQVEQLYDIVVAAANAVLADAEGQTEAQIEAAILAAVDKELTTAGLPAIDDTVITALIQTMLTLIQVVE